MTRRAHNMRSASRQRYTDGYMYATELGPGTPSYQREQAAARDVGSRSETDAAAYERHYHGDRYDDDRPSHAELAQHDADTRAERNAEAQAAREKATA